MLGKGILIIIFGIYTHIYILRCHEVSVICSVPDTISSYEHYNVQSMI